MTSITTLLLACNAMHQVPQRCARRLLMTHDRMHEQDFNLSHEFLAVMLGVQRPTVSVVAGSLQQAGLIRYTPTSIDSTRRSRPSQPSGGDRQLPDRSLVSASVDSVSHDEAHPRRAVSVRKRAHPITRRLGYRSQGRGLRLPEMCASVLLDRQAAATHRAVSDATAR